MNLVYICVFYNPNYTRLLELLLLSMQMYSSTDSFDILIMTSESLKEKIEEMLSRITIPCKIHCIPCETIFQAACARLHIFGWPEIYTYEKILYLDSDIIIRRDLNLIFKHEIEELVYGYPSGTLESPQFGGQFFDFSKINHRLQGINSGTLLFKPCKTIQDLFTRINTHIDEHVSSGKEIPIVMDQPFINYNVFTSNLGNNELLKPYISLYEDNAIVENADTACVCHFSYPIGNFGHKHKRMSDFFNELLQCKTAPLQIDLIGKKFSFGTGYIKFVINTLGYNELQTRWGKGHFTILGERTVCAAWNNYYHIMKFNTDATEYISIRTRPMDFDIIKGTKLKNDITIYGDSHAILGFYKCTLENRNLFQYSKTMYSVGRDTHIYNFKPEHNSKNEIFCLVYGEVDVRCHIGKQVEKGRDYESICADLVSAYIKTIQTLIKEYKAIILVGISPPVAMEDHLPCKTHSTTAQGPLPFIGTDYERVKYTAYMNMLLKNACTSHGFIYFNPYDIYTRDDGCLKYELSDTCIHIGDSSYFLDAFNKLYHSISNVSE